MAESNQETLRIDEKKCIKSAIIEDVRFLTIQAIDYICGSGYSDERKFRDIESALETSKDILKGVEKL